MTYSISVYRRELAGTPVAKFAEDPEAVPPFTPAQQRTLRDQLVSRGYKAKKSKDRFGHFAYPDIEARLTDRALSFSSGMDEESIYTILELGAELGMIADFTLFDPQAGTWSGTPTKKRAAKSKPKARKQK